VQKNLHKYYDQLHVLKELICIFKGEIVSIVELLALEKLPYCKFWGL
jgi:hypothetical protein